ncbi:hypothetical protein D1AOALGA4SA_163 [Olavius algarvensis Delta 1 endosymbiont]|nr:hypothetical protein D1AOALGA4SA_163 [Olavius algarvensis Delta 1 endosymbiont]
MQLENIKVDTTSREEIEKIIDQNDEVPATLEDIWQLMDKVWDNIGCDNINPDRNKIDRFYRHPVWKLNSIFIEQHDLSMQHRHAISDWICLNRIEFEIHKVVDYGGGFGTLAKLIAQKDPELQIEILEPYPNDYAKTSTVGYPNIRFIDSLNTGYDCLVSTDVLEHVYDPLRTFAEMIDGVRPKGYIIIANNFYPVIKCHLPGNFHLRYTFRIFARLMGLKYMGWCHGSHAGIYQKVSDATTNRKRLKRAQSISIMLFPHLERAHLVYKLIKKAFN